MTVEALKRVAVATAWGNEKNEGTSPAHLLYKSPRIKALYNIRGEFPLFILSAEYGLIDCYTQIHSYQRIMDRQRELAPTVATVIQQFDAWVYFKAGSRCEYSLCMKRAGQLRGKPLALVGFNIMGGLHESAQIAALLRDGKTIPSDIRSLELQGFVS